MRKTCFVIMGFGIKDNLDLDKTYNEIIKPCILENNLIPFPLYNENKFNAYRCDEISGNTSIDYKFVTCLNGADIVIADISTMNNNAIYELGARHALKPRSTILLCAKEKEKDFRFFDITYVPIIFYEHFGLSITDEIIEKVKRELNEKIDFCVNSTSEIPDNPIHRALNEKNFYKSPKSDNECAIYSLYKKGKFELDNNNFELAIKTFSDLYLQDSSEENLLNLILAKYKLAEEKQSVKDLIDCINLINEKIDVDVDASISEYTLGRIAAINLRVFNLTEEPCYYYDALKYYAKGSMFCKTNLYCPRNYCALLFRIHEVTEDINIRKEYYYTAKHFAKYFINKRMTVNTNGTYEQRVYYKYNKQDLLAIIQGQYTDFDKLLHSLIIDSDISERQRATIEIGIKKLQEDIDIMEKIIISC